MIFMWHPDAIDTYDAHLGELSQFSDVYNQSITGGEDTWITSITISHWRLHGPVENMIRRAENEVDDAERRVREERYNAALRRASTIAKESPPTRIMSLASLYRRLTGQGSYAAPSATPTTTTGEPDMEPTTLDVPTLTTTNGSQPGPNQQVKEPSHPKKKAAQAHPEHEKDDFPPQSVAEERSGKIHDLRLSLAITGDSRGRSWTCSMVCELFSEAQASDYALEAAETLQMFIHEQDTGRALVFMLLLGYMCEALAGECNKFIKELDRITGRSVSFTLTPLTLFLVYLRFSY